jgi:hypothetical protein
LTFFEKFVDNRLPKGLQFIPSTGIAESFRTLPDRQQTATALHSEHTQINGWHFDTMHANARRVGWEKATAPPIEAAVRVSPQEKKNRRDCHGPEQFAAVSHRFTGANLIRPFFCLERSPFCTQEITCKFTSR